MRSPVRFGAVGRERHTIDLAALPFQHRGCYTGHLYVWTARQPTQIIDRRDLPGLRRAAAAKFPKLDEWPPEPGREPGRQRMTSRKPASPGGGLEGGNET